MDAKEIEKIYSSYIGFSSGKISYDYCWKDVSLYHMAIGGYDYMDDYIYESNRKILMPTFATTCCYNIINNLEKKANITYASFDNLKELMTNEVEDKKKCIWLDFDHEMIFHRPLDANGGKLFYEDKIEDIYDRYRFGIVVKNHVNVYDSLGRLLIENIGNTAFLWGGNYGGKKFQGSRIIFPEREPDICIADRIDNKQHLLYRLLGDTSRMHIDDDYARERGFDGAIVHGFLTLGTACRHLVKTCISDDPNRIKRMKVQFKNVLYPNTNIAIEIWLHETNKVLFRLISKDTGKIILDRGEFEYS